MKEKSIFPPLDAPARVSRRNVSRNLKLVIITCMISYLLWAYRPSRLRSWRKPFLTENETWLLQISDLMTELYSLLERMKYIKPNAIAYPPHSNPSINTTLASKMGLSTTAITLLQILPYVATSAGPMYGFRDEPIMSATRWRALRHNNELVLTTAFADMRNDESLMRSRDPWYGDTQELPEEETLFGEVEQDLEGPLLKPWQLALTSVDRINWYHPNDSIPHGGIMVLDLNTRNLWTVGSGSGNEHTYHDGSFEDRGSIDPVTRGKYAEGAKPSKSRVARAKIETYSSRPATEALRDYIERVRSLEWVPGFPTGDRITALPRDTYRSLYKQHGWPDKFDGTAFDKARIAWDIDNRSKWLAAEPIRKLRELKSNLERDKTTIETWKSDLIKIDEILASEDAKSTRISLWDPRRKSYNGRNRAQTLEAIEFVGKRVREEESKLPVAHAEADSVSDEVRGWRESYIEKYGEDHQLEYQWEHIKYD